MKLSNVIASMTNEELYEAYQEELLQAEFKKRRRAWIRKHGRTNLEEFELNFKLEILERSMEE